MNDFTLRCLNDWIERYPKTEWVVEDEADGWCCIKGTYYDGTPLSYRQGWFNHWEQREGSCEPLKTAAPLPPASDAVPAPSQISTPDS